MNIWKLIVDMPFSSEWKKNIDNDTDAYTFLMFFDVYIYVYRTFVMEQRLSERVNARENMKSVPSFK